MKNKKEWEKEILELVEIFHKKGYEGFYNAIKSLQAKTIKEMKDKYGETTLTEAVDELGTIEENRKEERVETIKEVCEKIKGFRVISFTTNDQEGQMEKEIKYQINKTINKIIISLNDEPNQKAKRTIT